MSPAPAPAPAPCVPSSEIFVILTVAAHCLYVTSIAASCGEVVVPGVRFRTTLMKGTCVSLPPVLGFHLRGGHQLHGSQHHYRIRNTGCVCGSDSASDSASDSGSDSGSGSDAGCGSAATTSGSSCDCTAAAARCGRHLRRPHSIGRTQIGIYRLRILILISNTSTLVESIEVLVPGTCNSSTVLVLVPSIRGTAVPGSNSAVSRPIC